MVREFKFQNKVLAALDCYLDVLAKRKANADKLVKLQQENLDADIPILDFTEETFRELRDRNLLPPLRAHTPFSPHKDGCHPPGRLGRPVPNITLKVPTGGGKTWLATQSVSKILNKYLGQNTGFILWIVPNEAIYRQTLEIFKNCNHPYREALDMAAAGEGVKILEKEDKLDKRDIENHLCVMVLMLPSATRHVQKALRIFRERGTVRRFIPSGWDQDEHKKLHKAVPNLDIHKGFLEQVQIKASLGNALRIIRPVVVVDEGHKATSDLAYKTLYNLNPSFVLELTATPKDKPSSNSSVARYANLLVEITGEELDDEGMIKMPLTLARCRSNNWLATLSAAADKLDDLTQTAEQYKYDTNRYIRPIMLVQVERTGKNQRGGDHIHVEDVRKCLMDRGFDEDEIAVKTATQNDLKKLENKNLNSEKNKIRIVITKEALQEGWDCPFAYILCSLASRSNLNAMTQLVGRILRQPYAEKTNVAALDRCYVFTHQSQTKQLLEDIKKGFKRSGLSDLVDQIVSAGKESELPGRHKIYRRAQFKDTKIYLPQVLTKRDETMFALDYTADILCKTDWSAFDPSPIVKTINDDKKNLEYQIHYELRIAKGNEIDERKVTTNLPELAHFDPVRAVRKISDIVLNPFVAREIVGKLMVAFKAEGFDEVKMGKWSPWIIEVLQKELELEQDKQAETLFRVAVEKGDIQFRLRADKKNWKMPKSILTDERIGGEEIRDEHKDVLQKSVFVPVYSKKMNEQEKEVAVYLDGQSALGWWHRNVARQHYGLQGWRRGFIYPDFIFSIAPGGKTSKLVVLEAKGAHLYGNDDSEYKEAVMSLLSKFFRWDNTLSANQLPLKNKGEMVICDMTPLDSWKSNLPKYFKIDKKPD